MELYVDLAAKFGVVSSKPRTAGRQRNRANPHVADTKDYWRIILYYQFLDHLLNELRGRLVKNADRFLEQVLIAINLNKLKQEDELNICDAYRADVHSARVNPWSKKMESKVGIISQTM